MTVSLNEPLVLASASARVGGDDDLSEALVGYPLSAHAGIHERFRDFAWSGTDARHSRRYLIDTLERTLGIHVFPHGAHGPQPRADVERTTAQALADECLGLNVGELIGPNPRVQDVGLVPQARLVPVPIAEDRPAVFVVLPADASGRVVNEPPWADACALHRVAEYLMGLQGTRVNVFTPRFGPHSMVHRMAVGPAVLDTAEFRASVPGDWPASMDELLAAHGYTAQHRVATLMGATPARRAPRGRCSRSSVRDYVQKLERGERPWYSGWLTDHLNPLGRAKPWPLILERLLRAVTR